MPIVERDPWRFQFFDHVACPEDVNIPTDDPDCWLWYPEQRWIYDKLKIAESQGFPCGPHGVAPLTYPVFSKPVMNLKGMGIGSRVLKSQSDYEHNYAPGHFWMPLLHGPHVSTDCAIENGAVTWSRHATGKAWVSGTFEYWTIHAAPMPELEAYLTRWVATHMAGYCGMMNFETIGGRIIEAHLRFADQWCDLYGPGWIDALVGLYAKGRWSFDNSERLDGYSVPLFAAHGFAFKHPSANRQAEIRALPHVTSLQITFYENKVPADHPMPPGGFRLGIVNCTDFKAGLAARRKLAEAFPPDTVMLPE
jgi:hypothetical protein